MYYVVNQIIDSFFYKGQFNVYIVAESFWEIFIFINAGGEMLSTVGLSRQNT